MPTNTHDIFRGTTGVYLPTEVSSEIWSRAQEESSVMRLATPMSMPGSGVTVRMITGDPTANWVGETNQIGVSKGAQDKKDITPYKMGLIIPFSYEYLRDDARMYEELIARVPAVFAEKFDGTVFGKYDVPGANFDQLNNCTAVNVNDDLWAGFVAADAAVANNNATLNGYCISPKLKAMLLNAKDGNERPLFVNSIAANNVPTILGSSTYQSKAVYLAGSPNQLGIAGDWTSARYGVVDGMRISVANQGTLTDEDGNTINLFQDEMVALRFTMEVAFRVKDTNDFVRLTDAAV